MPGCRADGRTRHSGLRVGTWTSAPPGRSSAPRRGCAGAITTCASGMCRALQSYQTSQAEARRPRLRSVGRFREIAAARARSISPTPRKPGAAAPPQRRRSQAAQSAFRRINFNQPPCCRWVARRPGERGCLNCRTATTRRQRRALVRPLAVRHFPQPLDYPVPTANSNGVKLHIADGEQGRQQQSGGSRPGLVWWRSPRRPVAGRRPSCSFTSMTLNAVPPRRGANSPVAKSAMA